MSAIPSVFKTAPAVFAVGREYQIMVPVNTPTVMWVEVSGQCFYDDSNGILRSAVTTHRMHVPMELLDAAEEYRVCYRVVNERKPYFSDLGEAESYTSRFAPLPTDRELRIIHIADAHNRVEEPVTVGQYFGELPDLLILNGDIPNHSGNIEYFDAIYQIADGITHGERPVIFSRGNHDTRGIYAENIADHTPTENGRSYFTFRLGSVWGIVLDCGEDKPDRNKEYGNTVCCEDFRRRETAFIKDVIANKQKEYAAPGVELRLVISHVPFAYTHKHPFDIEVELFTEWCTLLREHVMPHLMLSGHLHKCIYSPIGGELDDKGQPCPVLVLSRPSKAKNGEEPSYTGAALTLTPDHCHTAFYNNVMGNMGEVEFDL